MKLSIITINYNNLEGLRQTIASVVGQTFHDFEYIIVDGDSTDGSKEFVSETAKKYPNLVAHAISEPDSGIYNAMNKGIRLAKGEYCLFLNSGDRLYLPTTIEEVFSNNLVEDIVYGYQYDDMNGSLRTELCIDIAYLTFDSLRRSHIPHQSTLIKRQALLSNNGYEERYRIISDWAFLMKGIFKMSLSIRRISTYIAVYDVTGISSNPDKTAQDKERADFLQREFPYIIPDYLYWDNFKKKWYMRVIFALKNCKGQLLKWLKG